MNETILILADDLTGAADTASRCRAAGLPATIFLAPPHPPLPAGVVAFTSDSRHLPPEEAARRVQVVATPLTGQTSLWYKKIDSTLRGNIGSELDALLALLNAPAALVCPTFPAQGRGLVNGHLVAPGGPPVGIHLPSLLREQSRFPVHSFSLEDVRSGELGERFQRKDAKTQRRGGTVNFCGGWNDGRGFGADCGRSRGDPRPAAVRQRGADWGSGEAASGRRRPARFQKTWQV